MAGLKGILLALVKVLCGGSTTEEQPPSEHYKLHERPPHRQVITTLPESRVAPEFHRRVSVVPYTTPLDATSRSSNAPHVHSQERAPIRAPKRAPKPIPQPHVDHKPQQDQSQISQHDEGYTALRAKANVEGDLMAQCFQQSHEAYDRRDRALAKQLSEEGKRHERRMKSLNAKASAWIFTQNNVESKPGEIDLHGLYVKEAVSYADKGIREARERGDAEIRFIVGKGLHSDGRVAKIKPAIEGFMKKRKIPTQVDPHNAGVLIARLS